MSAKVDCFMYKNSNSAKQELKNHAPARGVITELLEIFHRLFNDYDQQQEWL
jgi:predicted N-formylglutamate amidohydrolase